MFQLNFQDERLLPFEGTGAISRWRIELPHETNWFDIKSLTDAVLHVQYTSKDVGQPLRQHSFKWAEEQLPKKGEPGTRLIDLRHDLPAGLEQLNSKGACCLQLDSLLSFPWLNEVRKVSLTQIEFFATMENSDGETIALSVSTSAGDVIVPLYPRPSLANHFHGAMNLPNKDRCLELSAELPNDVQFRELFVQVGYFYQGGCE